MEVLIDKRYLDLLLDPLDECAKYKPKFGTNDSDGVSLSQFKEMYGADPFYHWIGLDSELMFAAHKAAGGMTSIYRQLGIGCEKLFRGIVMDALGLTEQQIDWSYQVKNANGKLSTLKLDAKIDLADLEHDQDALERFKHWLARCGTFLNFKPRKTARLQGVIFEVRQGYKSADAKRQNADLRFAMQASSQDYLPVFAIVSTQASATVVRRYRNSQMLVLTGLHDPDDMVSTFAFINDIVGYPLRSFFERNAKELRARCNQALNGLLSPA